MNEIDIRRIDVPVLLILRELGRAGRTTLVASQLGLSQSAVSPALARLRDVLGDPLFVRRSNGLEPTPRCLELLPKVETLLGLARELVDAGASFDPASTRRTFTLAGSDMVHDNNADHAQHAFRSSGFDGEHAKQQAGRGRAAVLGQIPGNICEPWQQGHV